MKRRKIDPETKIMAVLAGCGGEIPPRYSTSKEAKLQFISFLIKNDLEVPLGEHSVRLTSRGFAYFCLGKGSSLQAIRDLLDIFPLFRFSIQN